MILKILILSLTLLLMMSTLYSFWGESVRITFDENDDSNHDFCIDNNGTIHCVWVRELENNYWEICYTFSTDDGANWNEPIGISEDEVTRMGRPYIVCDSNNNLYVTYLYNIGQSTQLHFRIFDGNNWGGSYCISGNTIGVGNVELVVNNNDIVYAFWCLGGASGYFQYRYYSNESWSEIISPFESSNDYMLILSTIVDDQNNLHSVGVFHEEGGSGYDEVSAYYFFDYQNVFWDNPIILGYNTSWSGSTISLDENEEPHIIWRQWLDNNQPPTQGTLYSYRSNDQWTNPIVFFENGREQTMVFDNDNKLHLVLGMDFDGYNRLVHYIINNHHINEESILENMNAGWVGKPKLAIYNNSLYVLYLKSADENLDIYFNKYSEVTNIHDNYIDQHNIITLNQNFPNPFRNSTTISINSKTSEFVNLNIYNLKGQLIKTLINGSMFSGNNNINWDGFDNYGNKVASGNYLLDLNISEKKITKIITIMK